MLLSRWLPLSLVAGTLGVVLVAACYRSGGGGGSDSRLAVRGKPATHQPPRVAFDDITAQAGIHFVHVSGAEGDKRLPESMGSGAAFLDYDRDGRQDLLLVNGCRWSELPAPARQACFGRASGTGGDPQGAGGSGAAASGAAASVASASGASASGASGSGGGGPRSTLALYRNLGSHFEDVTLEVGLDLTLYGMGVACGDFDNDGWTDVFVAALGENRLLHNVGGTFVDVTQRADVAGAAAAWSTSCGWFDFDQDSDLDLFVCNYVQWDCRQEQGKACRLPDGTSAYCPPSAFAGMHPYLYRNEGDGTFTEVAAESGLHVAVSGGAAQPKALGVCLVDLDADGWMDLVMANDTVRNLLFRNRGDGRFEELGLAAGVAFDDRGAARGAMGIDSADFRNDGSLALAIGNFADEMAAVYVQRHGAWEFVDEARRTGIGAATLAPLTFGLVWLDYDLDSRLDLLLANGHLEPDIHRVDPASSYAQPAQLFWNAGPAAAPELRSVGPELAGADLFRPAVGRAVTYADVDADGDLDLLLTSCGERPRLLRNNRIGGPFANRVATTAVEQDAPQPSPDKPSPNKPDTNQPDTNQPDTNQPGANGPGAGDTARWLRFRLVGTACNRDAIGSWIELTVGGRTLRRQVMPTRGYLSQVELPVTFGLGVGLEAERIRIRWADGQIQTLGPARSGSLITVVQPSS